MNKNASLLSLTLNKKKTSNVTSFDPQSMNPFSKEVKIESIFFFQKKKKKKRTKTIDFHFQKSFFYQNYGNHFSYIIKTMETIFPKNNLSKIGFKS